MVEIELTQFQINREDAGTSKKSGSEGASVTSGVVISEGGIAAMTHESAMPQNMMVR